MGEDNGGRMRGKKEKGEEEEDGLKDTSRERRMEEGLGGNSRQSVTWSAVPSASLVLLT